MIGLDLGPGGEAVEVLSRVLRPQTVDLPKDRGRLGLSVLLALDLVERCDLEQLRWVESDLLQAERTAGHVLDLGLEEDLIGLKRRRETVIGETSSTDEIRFF